MVALTSSGKESLDKVVSELAARGKIPGFVLGATTADGEIYFNSGGYKVLDDSSSGVIDQDAVFWACSMTKFIAHTTALRLVDQGKLSVEDPVSKYFPQFSNTVIIDNVFAKDMTYRPGKEAVLVKHLLNYSCGLFYPGVLEMGLKMPLAYSGEHNKEDPHSEFFSLVQGDLPGIPLQFEPGTNFAYGFGSDVLGFIVEKITGITLEEYMKTNIFKPLDIKASFYLTPELKERLFPLYLKGDDGKLELWDHQPGTRILEHDPNKVARHLGGTGLYISLRDYLKFLRHILQIYDGKAENPILKQDTVKGLFVGTLPVEGSRSIDMLITMMTPHRGTSWSTALGVTLVDWAGARKKNSAFWSGWAGTHFWIDPTTGVAAVYGTQISSSTCGVFDPDTLKGLNEFEHALYAGLDS